MGMMMRQQRIWQSSKYRLHEIQMTHSVSTAISNVQSPTVLVSEEVLRIAVAISCAYQFE